MSAWSIIFDPVPAKDRIQGFDLPTSQLHEYEFQRGDLKLSFACSDHGISSLGIYGGKTEGFDLKGDGRLTFLLDSHPRFHQRFLEAIALLKRAHSALNFDVVVNTHDTGSESKVHSIVAGNEKTAHVIFVLIQLMSAPIVVRNGKVLFNTFTKRYGLKQSFSLVEAAEVADFNQLLAQVLTEALPIVAENDEFNEDEDITNFLSNSNDTEDRLFGINPLPQGFQVTPSLGLAVSKKLIEFIGDLLIKRQAVAFKEDRSFSSISSDGVMLSPSPTSLTASSRDSVFSSCASPAAETSSKELTLAEKRARLLAHIEQQERDAEIYEGFGNPVIRAPVPGELRGRPGHRGSASTVLFGALGQGAGACSSMVVSTDLAQ